VTVDDQPTPTTAYGLALQAGASDLDILAFLAVGTFALGPSNISATAVRVVDYETVARRFPDGDATPSVANGMHFMTANSASTAIINFADGVSDQEITGLCGESRTALTGSPQLNLTGPMVCKAGNVIRLRFNEGIWTEIGRTLM
jgi:hypothetical protein